MGRTRLKIYKPVPPPELRWQKTAALIDEIRAEADRMGSDYVMVIHPDQLQVEQDIVAAIKERYKLDLDGFDFKLPQHFLLEHCAQSERKCLDLFPVFRAQSESQYLLRDTHYNDTGNRLAAETIFELLRTLRPFSETEQAE